MSEWKKVASMPDRLREAMAAANKSQSDLAAASGLNKSTISRYMSGNVEPKMKAVVALARALDVDYQWLYGYDVPKVRTPEQKKNDDLVKVVAQLRKDPEFFDVVSMLAELPADQYASIKLLISSLGNK